MSFALRQPVPLAVSVYDAAPAAWSADATTAVLTIILPDGTSVTPTVTHADTGKYSVDYTSVQSGLHTVRWVFTGENASAPIVDAFYVEAESLPPLVSLAEVQQQCRATAAATTPILQRMMLVASSLCEKHTRIWRRQTLAVTKDGGDKMITLQSPVISVTTVTENGLAVSSTGWVLDSSKGWLYRGTATAPSMWSYGRQNIVVTYVAGAPTNIPPEIRQGVMLLVEHLWNTQRGGTGLPRSGDSDWTLPVGFTVPNAVLELWAPSVDTLVA